MSAHEEVHDDLFARFTAECGARAIDLRRVPANNWLEAQMMLVFAAMGDALPGVRISLSDPAALVSALVDRIARREGLVS